HYLLRQELLALHSVYSNMGAQFYQSYAQLSVSGSVNCVLSHTVSIPGAYKQNDPGILLQTWVASVPANGRKQYPIPS
ncbi:glycoside hydrolase, partial [Triangularia setosa]